VVSHVSQVFCDQLVMNKLAQHALALNRVAPYPPMSHAHTGLASSGAWCCFDEHVTQNTAEAAEPNGDPVHCP
jgi:hypothetical protein